MRLSLSTLVLFGLLALTPSPGSADPVDWSGHGASTAAFQDLASPAGLSPDTMEGIRRITALLRNHYRGIDRLSSERGRRPSPRQDRLCRGDEGSVCHGGDPDRGICNAGVPCHPTEEFLLEGLREEAVLFPRSGFLMGQAVYALTKFGRVEGAQELVEACEADPWWCQALEAYVLYSSYAPMVEVEARFRRAMESAPREIRCQWGDATWLLGEWDQRVGGRAYLPEAWEATRDWDCQRRLAASDTLFWLADPLYSREGNDRWTVHMARAMAAHLYADLREAVRGRPFPAEEEARDWAMRIRRGPWDSYQFMGGGRSVSLWTSQGAARYHFLPEVSLEDLSQPRWQLQGDILHEGYTPEYGPLFIIPAQVARFREDGNLKVAAAAGVEASRLGRALDLTAHLVLTPGPRQVSALETREFRQERPMVLTRSEPADYVVSLEVETDLGIGLHRELITPLRMDEPEVSDLALFDAEDTDLALFQPESTGLNPGGSEGITPEASGRNGGSRPILGGAGVEALEDQHAHGRTGDSRTRPANFQEQIPGMTGDSRPVPRGTGSEAPGAQQALTSLQTVGTRMLGVLDLEDVRELGVFWEIYGVPEDEVLDFELTLERAAGGLVDRLRGLFPGGEQEGRGRVSWTEASSGLTHPRAIILNLDGLQPGRYNMVLRARWGETVRLERRREFGIRESS